MKKLPFRNNKAARPSNDLQMRDILKVWPKEEPTKGDGERDSVGYKDALS